MKKMLVVALVVVVGLLAYTRLSASASEHRRAIDTVKTVAAGPDQLENVSCTDYGKRQIDVIGTASLWSCSWVNGTTGEFNRGCVVLSGKIPGVNGTGTIIKSCEHPTLNTSGSGSSS